MEPARPAGRPVDVDRPRILRVLPHLRPRRRQVERPLLARAPVPPEPHKRKPVLRLRERDRGRRRRRPGRRRAAPEPDPVIQRDQPDPLPRIRGPVVVPVLVDPDLLERLYRECDGYAQRVHEKLVEDEGIQIQYSTLTRLLREVGLRRSRDPRCQRVPDEPGAEMQHDTTVYTIRFAEKTHKIVASLLYLRYSKRRYLKFYRAFNRFAMKCFLHEALSHWGYAAKVCIIDNTNLARWRGLGSNAVMVPEMEAFGKNYGFRFLCHAPGHPDRKAGEERSFLTVETNFIPGRTFQNLEDLNRQALEWSTVRMEQRPQGKAGLIPAQAFEQERSFLTELPRHLPAPYLLLDRSVDEYGFVAVEGNYYEVPGTGRGQIQVRRYFNHLVLTQDRRALMEYALPPWGVKNQPFYAPGRQPRYRPRNRKLSSQEEEKRLRALDPAIGAYVDFILETPGLLRHQFLRRLWTFHQRWSTTLFLRTVERAHRYRITSMETLERIAGCRLQVQEIAIEI